MGWDSDKKQSKQVTIEQDFELAAYTVTQAQWHEVMGDNPSYFSREGGGKQAVQGIADEDLKRYPVESVSWNEVQEFLKKLNASATGRGWSYRLPSEAEWEYACRGRATSKEECSFDFYLDQPSNDLSWDQANFARANPAGKGVKGQPLNRTTKVGSYRPNKLGLYDMHGNVWQWCSDLYDAAGSAREVRGGGWGNDGQSCRAAFRYGFAPTYRSSILGFRLARVPYLPKDKPDPPRKVLATQKEEVPAPKTAPAPNEPLGMKFVKVPRGTFWMGWDSVQKQSKQMTIEQDFELAAYTVTQAQWQEVMGANPSWFSRQGGATRRCRASATRI